MVFKTDAEHHCVPRNISLHPRESVAATLGRKTVLSVETEENSFSYCIDMDARYLGLSAADVRPLVCHLATRNGLPHPFSHNRAAAGNKWLKGFVTIPHVFE